MFNWIILNLIGFIPVWIWPCIIGMSIAAYIIFSVLTNIPEISKYRLIILPSCAIICFLALFMFGGEGVAAIYKDDIKALANRVKIAEEKSRSVNTEIQTVIQYKTIIVTKFKDTINKKIEEQKAEINASCKLSDSAISLYNQAVLGNQIGLEK